MRKAERLNWILDRIAADGSVAVGDLAGQLGVSEATVRRDLQSLTRDRLLVRTHGGALARETGEEVPGRLKAARMQQEKRHIGQAAARLVDDGAVVGISGGTTSVELARELSSRRDLTVVTNAVDVAALLAGRPDLHLIFVGGIVRRSLEAVGPAAEEMLSRYHLDVVFIGVDGLTVDAGCTTFDEMEAQTDRAFLRQARRRVVIADSSKLGLVTFARIASVDEVTDLVTDAAADAGQVAALERAGLQVRLA
ncbi:DeoR/GlpR family DNA-binding transcription regulator [Nocardioides sp. T2.26MG-1]|uniref:DeoR/GlpR family DNA-binding transcription regulator n=1 Tax=Nocardioides sp. T2.26MG-1 TaxID=3041166 RepID=UPI002477ADC9|nr:DeoR/GlpR family DNA-binding transcription regulator [Nocardioides sp. T2.26MG-1]CAI9408712.1 Glycerol-3-phosphate regulon repressor [Nocardioides sp. T2.26MG-1]